MRTGQYDTVSASGDATLRLIAGGDVEPVNTSLITNYPDIFPALKKLGIKNPYALDATQLAAAVDLLKAQKADVGEHWSDYLKETQAFKAGSSVVGTTWQVIANLAQSASAAARQPRAGSDP
jgi:spermidine/putrescine-binding protein